jgi:amino acid adenylation domain-containing protein
MSIYKVLKKIAGEAPLSTALLGCSRPPLSYGELLLQIEKTGSELRRCGITRGDRVALVMPNGAESAIGCFAIAAAATCAPLNPAYSAAEFDFYLRDLKPKALALPPDFAPPAVAAARRMGVPLIHLRMDPSRPAGTFDLEGNFTGASLLPVEFADSQDVALVLHTSGSTARPKIVPLTHANLCASSRNIAASLSLQPTDRCLNIMPVFHIHGLIGAVLSSWSAGASVAAMPGFQATRFFDWVEEFLPTWYTAVPTMHQAILTRARQRPSARGTSLRFARSCSSALAPQLMAEVEDALGIPLIEAYGMTEASHQIAVNPLPPTARKPGSVGRGAGCEIAIMDPAGNILGPEEVGEVAIRGENVTAGYEDNPEANRASFTSGWFLTGDRGRQDHEGYLFLTGRSKEIINRGGEKISPREVDEVLAQHPAVQEVAAFALPDPRLGEEIAAAVVLKERVTASEADLQGFASRSLADFKIPRRIVFVPELPKGPTGKIQRIGLAVKLGLTFVENQPVADFEEPVTDTERALAEIWQKVLAVPRAGRHDNFFTLGGDSILATQVLVRLLERMAVAIPMFQLFGNPVLADFARVVEATPRIGSEQRSPIPVGHRGGLLPLSPAQERMWFLSRFEESSSAYCIPIALRLRGRLDVEALRRSLERIVARHEILRTRYVVIDGTPFQQVLAPSRFELMVEADQECGGDPLVRAGRPRPAEADQGVGCGPGGPPYFAAWEMGVDSPLRVRLVRSDPEDHLLVLVIHHIASDGWSKSVLFRELEACYAAELEGVEPELPRLPIQYSDYAQWQVASLDSAARDRLASFWTKELAGLPALLELPLDRPRPARQTFEGSTVRSELPASLRDALMHAGREESATLHMTLLAGLAVLLYRYSGQEEFCIGVPSAFRVRAEIEPLIGAFANTLPIRASVSGDLRFKDLLGRIRRNALEAHAHEELPLERIVEAVQPQRSLSYSPLFQVLFQLRNFPEIVTRLEGLRVEPVRFDSGTSQFDLGLEATETSTGLELALTFNTALFDRSTAERLLAHYRILLEAIAEDVEVEVAKLPLLSERERTQLLIDWNRTGAEYPRESALALFEKQAARCPASPAASGGGRSLSYRDLDRRASAIASHLVNAGVMRGSLVGICVERSPDMLAGLLGIWKAGAAYVPLDPSYPRQRLQFILEDSGAHVLLIERGLEGVLPGLEIPVLRMEDTGERLGSDRVGSAPLPDDLAYVLYTSGSSGKPKGVPIRHQSLVNLLSSMAKTLGFTPAERVLALTTISFDISCLELFLPLIAGAEVVVGGPGLAGDGAKLSAEIKRTQATLVQATPATWQILAGSGWTGTPGLKIVSGGESLPKLLAGKLCQDASLWNCYGPTETAIWSTVARIGKDDEKITIGTPIDNTQAYVLDSTLQPVPVGVAGELYLGGDGLSPGYWRRPDLTAEKFVLNPFSADPASRLYRTGDLVRHLSDGRIEFLRRLDNQVKLRGFRIELEEVESAAQTDPRIGSAAAVILNAGTPEASLALFYIAAASTGRSDAQAADDLRLHLKNSLPGYMVPSLLVRVDALPHTPGGKIDRRALMVASNGTISACSGQAAAAGVQNDHGITEELLLEIWEDVLGRRPIRRDDDFFALGGHSLLGTRLLARVENAFGVRLPLSTFFQAPSVAQMLAYLGPGAQAAHSRVIPIRSEGAGTTLYVLNPSPFFRSLYLELPQRARISAVSAPAPPAAGGKRYMKQMAERQLEAIRDAQREGPVALLGWCADGILALEIALQIRQAGRSAPMVALVDTFAPRIWRRRAGRETPWNRICRQVARGAYFAENLWRLGPAQCGDYLKTRWSSARSERQSGSVDGLELAVVRAAWEYEPSPYPGPVVLFRAQQRVRGLSADPASFWGEMLPNLEIVDVPGNHVEMLKEPNVQIIARHLSCRLGWDSELGSDISLDLRQLADALGYGVGVGPAVEAPTASTRAART